MSKGRRRSLAALSAPKNPSTNRVSKNKKQPRRYKHWSAQETNTLKQALEAKLDWDEISELLPNRDRQAIQSKCYYLIPAGPWKPKSNTDPGKVEWTAEQDERMLRLWFQNVAWADIAEVDGLPTKSVYCMRARKVFLEKTRDPVYMRVMAHFMRK
jgi:hypothetical protein